MRRFWLRYGIGAAAAAFVLGNSTLGLAQFFQQRSNAAPAAPPEVRWITPVNPKPAAPAAPSKPAEPPRANHDSKEPRYHHHHHDYPRAWYGNSGWGFSPWVVWGGGYPVLWTGTFTPGFSVYNPNLVAANPALVAPPVVPQVVVPPQPAADEPAKPEVRATNADTKARAGKFIGYGDALFAKQNYLAATSRYRTAASVAPDMSEPSMRQGFALVALGSYESAAKAFRRALSIRPDWSGSPFRLRDLYQADVPKTAHLEALAAAIEANAFDAEVVMVLAIELYFDGQRERAELFFHRAVQLGANEDHLLDAFLVRPAGADNREARPAPAANNNKGPAKVVF